MRSRVALALCIALLLLAACSTTRGSGQLATAQREVSGFTKVELTGQGDLTIEQTGTESLDHLGRGQPLAAADQRCLRRHTCSRNKTQHLDCHDQADHLLSDRQGPRRPRGIWIRHDERSKAGDD